MCSCFFIIQGNDRPGEWPFRPGIRLECPLCSLNTDWVLCKHLRWCQAHKLREVMAAGELKEGGLVPAGKLGVHLSIA